MRFFKRLLINIRHYQPTEVVTIAYPWGDNFGILSGREMLHAGMEPLIQYVSFSCGRFHRNMVVGINCTPPWHVVLKHRIINFFKGQY